MENLTELKRRITEYLASLATFEDAVILAAYPEKQRAFPLKNPVVAVETAGAELVNAGLGGFLGGQTADLYGASALITLRFGIYDADAAGCGVLFESLCGALFDAAWLGFQKISCDTVCYDSKTAAFSLTATAVLKAAWVVPGQNERLFENIQIIC